MDRPAAGAHWAWASGRRGGRGRVLRGRVRRAPGPACKHPGRARDTLVHTQEHAYVNQIFPKARSHITRGGALRKARAASNATHPRPPKSPRPPRPPAFGIGPPRPPRPPVGSRPPSPRPPPPPFAGLPPTAGLGATGAPVAAAPAPLTPARREASLGGRPLLGLSLIGVSGGDEGTPAMLNRVVRVTQRYNSTLTKCEREQLSGNVARTPRQTQKDPLQRPRYEP